MQNPNLQLLEAAAGRLRPLLSELVFVGGCITGLLIDDPGAAPVRATYDVDVIVEIGSYADYAGFSERLRALGFQEDDTAGAPLCRWRHGDLITDVMPLDPGILGFSNRWYPDALHAAVEESLASGNTVRIITAPYFLATKLEAFRGRGKGDYFASHDLEDFIAVVDGRLSILDEMQAARSEVRMYIANGLQTLLAEPRFQDALPGYLLPDPPSQGRIGLLAAKLRSLSKLPDAFVQRHT